MVVAPAWTTEPTFDRTPRHPIHPILSCSLLHYPKKGSLITFADASNHVPSFAQSLGNTTLVLPTTITPQRPATSKAVSQQSRPGPDPDEQPTTSIRNIPRSIFSILFPGLRCSFLPRPSIVPRSAFRDNRLATPLTRPVALPPSFPVIRLRPRLVPFGPSRRIRTDYLLVKRPSLTTIGLMGGPSYNN